MGELAPGSAKDPAGTNRVIPELHTHAQGNCIPCRLGFSEGRIVGGGFTPDFTHPARDNLKVQAVASVFTLGPISQAVATGEGRIAPCELRVGCDAANEIPEGILDDFTCASVGLAKLGQYPIGRRVWFDVERLDLFPAVMALASDLRRGRPSGCIAEKEGDHANDARDRNNEPPVAPYAINSKRGRPRRWRGIFARSGLFSLSARTFATHSFV